MPTPKPQQLNLCFHGIGTPGRELDPGEDAYWITPRLFEQVLDLVVGRRDVRLSFDDGNASDARIGLPALRERGLRAEFFPIAARIGQPGSTDRDDLHQLVAAGMTIGSHGMNHRPWRGMADPELTLELVEARALIAEAAGTTVDTAACPFGRYDRRSTVRLRRLGYTRVYTSDRSSSRPSWWLQPRFSIRRGDTVESVQATVDAHDSDTIRLSDYARMIVKRWR